MLHLCSLYASESNFIVALRQVSVNMVSVYNKTELSWDKEDIQDKPGGTIHYRIETCSVNNITVLWNIPSRSKGSVFFLQIMHLYCSFWENNKLSTPKANVISDFFPEDHQSLPYSSTRHPLIVDTLTYLILCQVKLCDSLPVWSLAT